MAHKVLQHPDLQQVRIINAFKVIDIVSRTFVPIEPSPFQILVQLLLGIRHQSLLNRGQTDAYSSAVLSNSALHLT